MEIFHGGCHGCVAQELHGVHRCVGCQYFDAEWNKPDMSIKPEEDARKERKKQIRREAKGRTFMTIFRKKPKGVKIPTHQHPPGPFCIYCGQEFRPDKAGRCPNCGASLSGKVEGI